MVMIQVSFIDYYLMEMNFEIKFKILQIIQKILMRALIVSLMVCISVCIVPRMIAPDFTSTAVMPDLTFKEISLHDYLGKYVVLLFYPFDFTYVCPTEIISFSQSTTKFQEIGAQILGISVDSHFSHLAWRKTERSKGGLGQINFPLLSDLTKYISDTYGVLVTDPQDGLYGATLRGLFIIDEKGIIRSVTINDEQVGRSVDEAIRLVKAFKHADKNGVVCPANWQPGAKTIIPDQQKMKEYFKNEL